jgi:hypothetical protein
MFSIKAFNVVTRFFVLVEYINSNNEVSHYRLLSISHMMNVTNEY